MNKKDKQIREIERIIYYWARYSGIRTPNGKTYSKSEIADLIYRLIDYKDFPEKFNFDEGKVILEEHER